jgi:VWFA-related protein
VTIKLIQVIVTDRKGNPVIDLRKEDFLLTDNGQEMKLTEFEKHVLQLPQVQAAGEEKLGPTPLSTKPRLLNRQLFILFDFAYTDENLTGLRVARKAALDFIDTKLIPSDEVGVISFSGKRDLQIHEFQTMDHQKIRKAVESLGIKDVTGVVTPGSVAGWSEARFVARNFAWALTAFAQALRYIPGQKQIILISKGIRGSFINSPESRNSDLRYAFTQLGKELATSNISIYPINTEDPMAPLEAPESQRGASTLRELASITGGRYLGNAVNSSEHFEKIQILTGTYYVLGYPITETWDGKYHKIKVKVSRADCEIHAQAGYLDPKPFGEYSDLEKKIHLVDLALAEKPLSQTPVRFAMQAMACSGAAQNNLGFVAEIPLEKLGEVIGKKIEVVSLVFNDADDIIDQRRTESDFKAMEQKKVFLFSLLSAASGNYRCRVVLRNLETGRAAVAATTAAVPEWKPDELLLFPPLFLTPEKGGVYIGENTAKGSGGKAGPSLAAKVFLFDMAQYAPRLEASLKRGSEIWAAVRCAVPKGLAGDIRLAVSMLDGQSGEEITIPLTVITRNDSEGIKAFFIRFEIPSVEPDTYRFSLLAEGPSGKSSRLVRDIVIK